MIGVGFKFLARSPVPQLPLNYPEALNWKKSIRSSTYGTLEGTVSSFMYEKRNYDEKTE